MGFQHFKHIAIRGIAACVPKHVEDNRELELLGNQSQREKFIENTGIARRHTVRGQGICSSDMCYSAAESLIDHLKWDKSEIDCLIFVSQTPDYIFPATSCILQNRLGLSKECYAMDISLGCSGWIHGMATMGAFLQNGNFKKGLLLVGDTSSITKSPKDKVSYPLFGDAGTATALEFSPNATGLRFHTSTDGSKYQAVMIPDGGFRNFYSEQSLVEKEYEDGNIRSNLHTILDGPGVFTFGITKAPRSIKALVEHFKLDLGRIDYLLLHQANKMMLEKIRKKLKFSVEQVPYSLDEFGNTSCSSIPLTLVSRLKQPLMEQKKEIIACGFGVGLSWGSIHFKTDQIACPALQMI